MRLFKNLVFPLVIIISLFFRFYLTPKVFHHDLICQASWGKHIYFNTAQNFYKINNKWLYFSSPNHPPLTNILYATAQKIDLITRLPLVRSSSFIIKNNFAPLLLQPYFLTLKNLDHIVSPEQPFTYGFLLSLKTWAILADILIAIVIYKIAKKYNSHPLIFPLIYLFSPFSWYLSALWGQTDQLGFLFTLLSFILLPKLTILPIITLFISASIKPTSLMFSPLFLYILFLKKPKIYKLVISGIICFILCFFIFKPFYQTNFFHFTFKTLFPKLVNRAEFRVSTNAYNFWHIFTLGKAVEHNTKIFSLISYKNLGLLLYIAFTLYSFKILKKIKIYNILVSLFIISGASWLFLTNMLDRYFFTAIATGLVLLIFKPKSFKYWLPLSLIFWLNLFRQWYYPQNLEFLKNILEYNHKIIGSYLSIANVILFLLSIKIFISSSPQDNISCPFLHPLKKFFCHKAHSSKHH